LKAFDDPLNAILKIQVLRYWHNQGVWRFFKKKSWKIQKNQEIMTIMKDFKPLEGQEAWQFHHIIDRKLQSRLKLPLLKSMKFLSHGVLYPSGRRNTRQMIMCRPWRSSCCSMVSQGEYRTSRILCMVWQLLESEGYCELPPMGGHSFIHSARSTSQAQAR